MKNIKILSLILTLLCSTSTIAIASNSYPVGSKRQKKQSTEFDQIKQLISISLGTYPFSSFNEELPIPESIEINNAIKKGDATELSRFFNSAIEISLPDNDGTYSKVQAQMILFTFFEKNQAKSFTVIQEGSSPNNTNFVIGTYISTNNKRFRVYYVTKIVGGKDLIQHLEFELK